MKEVDIRFGRIRNRLITEGVVRLILVALLWWLLCAADWHDWAPPPVEKAVALIVLVMLPDLIYKMIGFRSGRTAHRDKAWRLRYLS